MLLYVNSTKLTNLLHLQSHKNKNKMSSNVLSIDLSNDVEGLGRHQKTATVGLAECSNSFHREEGGGGKLCNFHPNSHAYKYVILVLICIVKFGVSYVYDCPAGLEKVIIDTLHLDVSQYSLLYSVFSWPNVILSALGGIIIDRILGIRLGTLLFIALSTIGQLIFALGAFFDVFWLMVVARFIIGVGGEITFIVTDAFAALWFKGKETLIFAILGAACRFGGCSALYLNQLFYDYSSFIANKSTQLGFTLLIPFTALVLCLIAALLLAGMDKRAEKILKRDNFTKKKVSFKDLKDFGINYWLVVVVSVIYFSTVFPFVAIAQMFFTSKFGLSVNEANIASLVTYIIPIIAPLFGLIISWTGFNVSWGLLGIVLTFGAHSLFLLSNGASYVPFIANSIIGLSFSCFNTAMWATPALLVKEHQLATSYGILESVLNAGYAVVDIVAGQLIDNYGYTVQEVFFLCFQALGIMIILLLIFRLSGSENLVNTSGWKRRRLNYFDDNSEELEK